MKEQPEGTIKSKMLQRQRKTQEGAEMEKKKASKYMKRWLREIEKQKGKIETPRTKPKRLLKVIGDEF